MPVRRPRAVLPGARVPRVAQVAEAKQVCARCAVRTECLASRWRPGSRTGLGRDQPGWAHGAAEEGPDNRFGGRCNGEL